MFKYFSRKANAFIEYSVVLVIIVGVMGGLHHFLRRSVQARIKGEIDAASPWGKGSGLEWEENTLTWRDSANTVNKIESIGGGSTTISTSTDSYNTLALPMPPYVMEHKNAGRDAQDVGVSPPKINLANHKNTANDDQVTLFPAP